MAQLTSIFDSKKLRGFVLLEGIFAMIIIMICFGIATATLNNIANSDKLSKRIEARIAVHNLIIATKRNNSSTDTSYTVGRLIVRRTLLIRNDIPDCGEYVFTITDPDNSVIDTYHLLRYNAQ